MIRISPIRVIGPDNEQVGVIETQEALRMADEAGLDLVEISADARPPVCKIMDYGKFKYEQSKKEHKQRASSKQMETKEIRLGRSVKIDPHDVEIRVNQARKFLMAGHKVQFTQRFRGREIAHNSLGLDRLRQIMASLEDVSKPDSLPRLSNRTAQMLLAPDKAKIDAIKRAEAKAAADAAPEAKTETKAEAPQTDAPVESSESTEKTSEA